MSDPVNHPDHYNSGPIETIEIIRHVCSSMSNPFRAYCIGNVLKYVCRHPFKGNPLQDLKKAAWYLAKAIEHYEDERIPEAGEQDSKQGPVKTWTPRQWMHDGDDGGSRGFGPDEESHVPGAFGGPPESD